MTLSPIAASAVRIAEARNEAQTSGQVDRAAGLQAALDILAREGDVPLAAVNYLAGKGAEGVANLAALVGGPVDAEGFDAL